MLERSAVYVLPGLRSPFTKIDRGLQDLDGLKLSVPVVQQTVAGSRGVGPDGSSEVDLVIWGSVIPTLSIANWGREVWLDARLDPHVPALTVVQQCATSLAAATYAAGQIRGGHGHLALCGGVESMSSTQVGLSLSLSRKIRRAGSARGPLDAARTLAGIRPSDLRLSIPAVEERTTGKSMGEHTEEMARDWEIPRTAQDEFAVASHHRAVRAAESGFFRPLLVSPGTFGVDADNIPRANTSVEALSRLPAAFDRKQGSLTAGNSSPLTDGAACCWVADEEGVARLPDGLPRVKLLDWEMAAIDPRTENLLIAPALAIPRMLARQGLRYEDIGLWEIHEAFAAQVLATVKALQDRGWIRERAGVDAEFGDVPAERINPNGGSVALGHPFAATGARILSQAAAELAELPSGTRGLVSICAAGGLGHVALLEAVG
ncbi:MAG: acetyl-CoA C-acyltransferase [Gemmatimonadales bacterium]|jgi:acetyl-CoA C-acetyltransferase